MIRIGHMTLRLPPEYADRAGEIAHHACAALADLPVAENRQISHVGDLRLTLPRGASSTEAGRAIAAGLAARTGLTRGGGHD